MGEVRFEMRTMPRHSLLAVKKNEGMKMKYQAAKRERKMWLKRLTQLTAASIYSRIYFFIQSGCFLAHRWWMFSYSHKKKLLLINLFITWSSFLNTSACHAKSLFFDDDAEKFEVFLRACVRFVRNEVRYVGSDTIFIEKSSFVTFTKREKLNWVISGLWTWF